MNILRSTCRLRKNLAGNFVKYSKSPFCKNRKYSNYEHQHNSDGRKNSYNHDQRTKFYFKSALAMSPLLCLPWFVTIKDILGIEPVVLDKDPIKDKIKQALLCRRYKKYDEALQHLHEALKEAFDTKIEEYVTRIYDEMANTYYEKEDLENAEKLFRETIQRLIKLHSKNELSPEFIGISLKLSDIFARRGDLVSAEAGFKHCVSKQMLVMEEHLKKFLLAKGANFQEKYPVDTLGPTYSDPIALFGMALESYAYFLLDNFGEERFKEIEEYMDEVIKISFHIYGAFSEHSINILNNFGSKCILKNRFEMALKYLEIGVNRVLQVNGCAPLLIGYYCNYAEALFHCGQGKKAVEIARRAELMAQSQEPRIRKHAEKFRREIERDAKRKGVDLDVDSGGSSWRKWLPV